MEKHGHRKWLLATPLPNDLPVGVGDQCQASIVPRHLPQDGEDEEQHLHEAEGHGGLPVSIGYGGHPSGFGGDSAFFLESPVRHPGQSQAGHLFGILVELYPNKCQVPVCLTFCYNAIYRPITLSLAKVGCRTKW